ncbi:unnamed protein product [Schistosoma margrebowiei]|uniref:Uncharacterized protein n=1 Tax=Schistosoma margrebowiei TaxID=48269 RepID=A0A3P8AT51_9TREM|nr:unnamed protein product [Schistosoma margrebowiei]
MGYPPESIFTSSDCKSFDNCSLVLLKICENSVAKFIFNGLCLLLLLLSGTIARPSRLLIFRSRKLSANIPPPIPPENCISFKFEDDNDS